MEISSEHPRYRSLVVRERLSELMRKGIVAPTGLIAHGRGEAFDYLLGERTTKEAEQAERAASALLLQSKRPVITVNGNTAALAAPELAELAREIGAPLEVNLFHRSLERVEKVCDYVERTTGMKVLGREADAIVPGIASDRALCSREGIFSADVVLISLEDGDRAQALVAMGKKVIAIDLNPLSRTAMVAHISIVDELTRAVPRMIEHCHYLRAHQERVGPVLEGFDNQANLAKTRKRICRSLGQSR